MSAKTMRVAAALAAAALAAAAAGCAPAADQPRGAGAASEQQAQPAMEVTLDGQSAELEGDRDGFAEALAAYLGENDGSTAARAVTGPAGGLYVLVGGEWLGCKCLGSPGAWAFTPFDGVPEELVTEHPQAAQPERPEQSEEGAPAETAAQNAAEQAQDAAEQAELVPIAKAAGEIGEEAAAKLDDALAGYLPGKGIAYQAGTAGVEVGSARREPGGVGFVVAAGAARIDVVYADGAYGFLVL